MSALNAAVTGTGAGRVTAGGRGALTRGDVRVSLLRGATPIMAERGFRAALTGIVPLPARQGGSYGPHDPGREDARLAA